MSTDITFKANLIPAEDNTYTLGNENKKWKIHIDAIYPIGSIYISVNSTNPSILFGGTWEQIENTFLLAAGSTYTAGNTGGNSTITLQTTNLPPHTHNLSSHYHNVPSNTGTANNGGNSFWWSVMSYGDNVALPGQSAHWKNWNSPGGGSTFGSHEGTAVLNHTHSVTVNSINSKGPSNNTSGSTGSGTAISIMPPYLAVYMWKRIA